MLLAYDPGADAGWALFEPNARLVACGLVTPATPLCDVLPLFQVTKAVVERPVIYPGAKQQASANDIILLATRAGERVGEIRAVQAIQPSYIEPAQWKAQLDKETANERVWTALLPNEQQIVATRCKGMAPSKRHNVLDAIGIGLFTLGRVGRGCTTRKAAAK